MMCCVRHLFGVAGSAYDFDLQDAFPVATSTILKGNFKKRAGHSGHCQQDVYKDRKKPAKLRRDDHLWQHVAKGKSQSQPRVYLGFRV